jgi:lactate dehydrogenase-like 2-hydroxyacid dehydrogenase
MVKPKVFVTRLIANKALDMLRVSCDVKIWEEDSPVPYDVLRREITGIDALLSMLTDHIDANLLRAGAPRLKVVSQMAVGFDNIDVGAATASRIPVGNTPGILTETTADLSFALLMAAARRISEAERFVRDGQWQTWGPALFMGQDIYGATLGIIGMGRIGQAVARRARGFEMRVIYYNDSEVKAAQELDAEFRPLDDLYAESDFISLHTPLTPATHHLIDERALKRMKPTCVLINTARGSVVDPDALYEALTSGTIGYAALDVTEPEPILVDSPLLTLENCLIVPHIGSSSVQTRTRMAVMAAENLLAGLEGRPLPHCVNPQVYNRSNQ